MADLKLDKFTRAYIEAALWSTTNEEPRRREGECLDASYDVEDLAPETLARIEQDCARFQERFGEQIDAAVLRDGRAENREAAGHDFWLTRNRHGAGFWDGDWPKPIGEQLTEESKAFGECTLYVGDDDKLYLM